MAQELHESQVIPLGVSNLNEALRQVQYCAFTIQRFGGPTNIIAVDLYERLRRVASFLMNGDEFMQATETAVERVDALSEDRQREVLIRVIRSVEENGRLSFVPSILHEWSLIDNETRAKFIDFKTWQDEVETPAS